MSHEALVVGRIIKAHGLKGFVAIKVETDNLKRFSLGSKLFLWPPLEEWPYLTVEAVKQRAGGLLIKFVEITGKRDAERLIGHDLVIPETAGEKPENSFWLHEIIGLKVFTEEGLFLGTVKEIIQTGANDVYVVKNGKEYLLPAIKEVIKEVNLKEQKMVVHLLPGLAEL